MYCLHGYKAVMMSVYIMHQAFTQKKSTDMRRVVKFLKKTQKKKLYFRDEQKRFLSLHNKPTAGFHNCGRYCTL